jgi:hypothetical protein
VRLSRPLSRKLTFGTEISAPVLSDPPSPELREAGLARSQEARRGQLRRSVTLADAKQLAAVFRIKALRRLHCCALAVASVGEREHRPSQNFDTRPVGPRHS